MRHRPWALSCRLFRSLPPSLFIIAALFCTSCAQHFAPIPREATRLDQAATADVVANHSQREQLFRSFRGLFQFELLTDQHQAKGRIAVASRDYAQARLDIFPPGAPYAVMLIVLWNEVATVIDSVEKRYSEGAFTAREVHQATGLRLSPGELLRLALGLPARPFDDGSLRGYRLPSGSVLLEDGRSTSRYVFDQRGTRIEQALVAERFSHAALVELRYGYREDGQLEEIEAKVPGESTTLLLRVEKLHGAAVMQDSLFELKVPDTYRSKRQRSGRAEW
ncbi:MAG: hypothetical protein QY326_04740 [Bdellovibrionota bacterium]|nr:MAG: hypothetical protein QY326_04740 [Bdellovibrionota bacterium]